MTTVLKVGDTVALTGVIAGFVESGGGDRNLYLTLSSGGQHWIAEKYVELVEAGPVPDNEISQDTESPAEIDDLSWRKGELAVPGTEDPPPVALTEPGAMIPVPIGSGEISEQLGAEVPLVPAATIEETPA